MNVTSSPFRYPGGKSQLTNYVNHLLKINYINDTYIEPFAGGAGVAINLLLNGSVSNIVINDYDKSIYSVWHAILNNPKQLISMIKQTDVTIDEWYNQKEIHDKYSKYQNSIENAFSTLFLNRTTVSGIISGGPIGGYKQKGKYKINCRFNKDKLISRIKLINNRKKDITITRINAIDFIDRILPNYDFRKVFIFFDPPYYKQGKRLYLSSFSSHEHKKLADKIQNLDKYKWITTYDCEEDILQMYSKSKSFEYSLRYSANHKRKASEYLFTNEFTKVESFERITLKRINNSLLNHVGEKF